MDNENFEEAEMSGEPKKRTKAQQRQYNFKYGHIAVLKDDFNEFRKLKEAAAYKTDAEFQKKLLECWKQSQEQLK